MNRQIFFGVIVGLVLLNVCAGVEAKPPTCTQPVGKWQNERGSVLEIKSYDAATGAVAAQYSSHSGAAGTYPVVGWMYEAPVKSRDPCKDCKVDHAVALTFLVHWGASGGASAWTGTCGVNAHSGLEQISALWHTTRPNANRPWRHTLTGADRFNPFE
jgi:hypothetical protein